MDKVNKVLNIIGKAYIVILVVMTMILVFLGCYQVAGRYFFKWNISWTEELMRYIYAGTIFYGLGLVAKHDSFVSITILSDKIKSSSKIAGKILTLFHILMQLTYFIIMAYFGWLLAVRTGKTLTPAAQIPFFWVNVCLPVGGLMGAVVMTIKLLQELFPKKFGNKEAVEQ